MNNTNVYSKLKFEEEFKHIDIYKQLQDDFDLITFESNLNTFHIPGMTPRQNRGTRIVSAVPFYFIEQMKNNGPIYDIGCGWNLYARYYDNVIGISGETETSKYYYGNEHGWIDSKYIEDHYEYFDNIITMNALHFIPFCDLSDRINQIIDLTKPNGYIFIMFNICHMFDNSNDISELEIVKIRNIVSQISHDILSFELLDDYIKQNMSEGTFRLLLKKKPNADTR